MIWRATVNGNEKKLASFGAQFISKSKQFPRSNIFDVAHQISLFSEMSSFRGAPDVLKGFLWKTAFYFPEAFLRL
jgi:hypothetical protein